MATKEQTVIETELTFLRETKNTFVFANEDEDAPVSTQYVRKDAFPGSDPPASVKLTIEVG